MGKAGNKINDGLAEALAVSRGDREAISKIRVTPSCGCVFCDLKIQLHEDDQGFHHVAEGERIPCHARSSGGTVLAKVD
jgi:hypothetical protein